MARLASFALFFVIVIGLASAIHYYLWVRLVRDVGLPPGVHKGMTALVVFLWASVPLSFILGRALSDDLGKWPLMLAFGWIGVMFLLLVGLVFAEVSQVVLHGVRRFVLGEPPFDPEKRLTLARLLGGGVALLAGGAAIAAVRSGLAQVAVREVRIALDRLPRELDGTTIVQLTDVHVGPTIGREFVEDIVRRTNALEPDVIAITGDLVDGSVEQLKETVAPLGELKARFGVYFVTGNHEYYSGVEDWCAELERLGIKVLRNERVAIQEGAAGFDLAGVDDASAGRFGNGHGPDLARALTGRDPEREVVLLAHQPRAVTEAAEHGVSLQLSGHTHGGQLWPWNYFVKLQQPVVSGLERIKKTWIYVSNGTGYWGPPMRLGAPAEITKVVLSSSRTV